MVDVGVVALAAPQTITLLAGLDRKVTMAAAERCALEAEVVVSALRVQPRRLATVTGMVEMERPRR
jgi:hypothetical protein